MTQTHTRFMRNPIIITTPVREPRDLYDALARATYRAGRPAPRNLDGMADLIREFGVSRVLCAHWRLPDSDDARVRAVLADLGVELQL